jgi:hypothetical protein
MASPEPDSGATSMDTPSNIADTLDQADEEILTYTVSDEALEAAAGMAGGQQYTPNTNIVNCTLSPGQCCSPRPESRSGTKK